MLVDSDLLLAIYEGVTSDEAFERVLALLAASFDCNSAALLYVAPSRPVANIAAAYGTIAEPAVRRLYEREFATIDPAPGLMARLSVGEVTSTDQAYSARDLALFSRFLNDFYYPVGLGGALGGPIANQDGQLGMVAVQRPRSRAPFDDADARSFRAVMPHLVKAIALRSAFFEVSVRAEAWEQSCEAIPMGMMVFGPSGALERANLLARRILARRDGLSLDRAGRLRAEDREANRTLRRLLDDASPGGSVDVLKAPRSGAVPPYGLRVLRRPRSAHLISILVSDPSRVAPSAEDILSALFGITTAQARVATALVEGVTLNDYADRAEISINTAKTHLRSVFQALGVNRQSEMIRLAGLLLHDLA